MQSIVDSFAQNASDCVQVIPDFTLLFLSGFDFSKDLNLQRRALNALRKKNCAIVLIDADGLCDSNAIKADNIFTCTLKRKIRSNRNLIVEIQTKSGKQMPIHVSSPDDHILWLEQKEDYIGIEPLIAECVKQGKTAKEIIEYLNKSKGLPLTIATLARLKRKWGIRTYRKEKHPRKSKKKS